MSGGEPQGRAASIFSPVRPLPGAEDALDEGLVAGFGMFLRPLLMNALELMQEW